LVSNSRDKVNKSSRKDVLFILNWGGLSTTQDFKIVSSYECDPQKKMIYYVSYKT